MKRSKFVNTGIFICAAAAVYLNGCTQDSGSGRFGSQPLVSRAHPYTSAQQRAAEARRNAAQAQQQVEWERLRKDESERSGIAGRSSGSSGGYHGGSFAAGSDGAGGTVSRGGFGQSSHVHSSGS
jgi:hypothetical protein